jgi:hypothetical protein
VAQRHGGRPPSTAVPGIDTSCAASPSVFGRRISATMAPPPTANGTIMVPIFRRCKAAPGCGPDAYRPKRPIAGPGKADRSDLYSAFAGLCTPSLFFVATWV